MDKHSENFEKIKAQLHEQGYHEKDVTFTSGKAMILGVFYALPMSVFSCSDSQCYVTALGLLPAFLKFLLCILIGFLDIWFQFLKGLFRRVQYTYPCHPCIDRMGQYQIQCGKVIVHIYNSARRWAFGYSSK